MHEAGGHIYISDSGKKLGKIQERPQYFLTRKSKDFFIKNILLNTLFVNTGFISIIKDFEPIQKYNTYVYFRTFRENFVFINWLKTLESIGFTLSLVSVVLINKEYLEVFNLFLFRVRTSKFEKEDSKDDFRKEIGDTAEMLTLDYERERLTKQGYPELADLIEHLSPVDNYLGYDILSFQGTGKNPTKKKYIEVKGTVKSEYQFVFSRNERMVASEKKEQYWIYCYRNVKSTLYPVGGPFKLCNPIMKLKQMDVLEEPDDIFYLIK
ncbi:MAG: DUF3883 domain-containing protein [Bacteroidota bacterium]